MQKFVIAPTHGQARHYAAMMGWTRAEWRYVSQPEHLKGLEGVNLYDIRAPRMSMDEATRQKYSAIMNESIIQERTGHITKRHIFNLK